MQAFLEKVGTNSDNRRKDKLLHKMLCDADQIIQETLRIIPKISKKCNFDAKVCLSDRDVLCDEIAEWRVAEII